jgi:hypothetical protein
MDMELNTVVDRGKTRAESLVETIPPIPRIGRRRKSRAERLFDAVQELPSAARVGLVAAATGVVVGVAFLARKRLFGAAAVVADVIEGAADAVEDAAEDLGDAARKRSDSAPGD